MIKAEKVKTFLSLDREIKMPQNASTWKYVSRPIIKVNAATNKLD